MSKFDIDSRVKVIKGHHLSRVGRVVRTGIKGRVDDWDPTIINKSPSDPKNDSDYWVYLVSFTKVKKAKKARLLFQRII